MDSILVWAKKGHKSSAKIPTFGPSTINERFYIKVTSGGNTKKLLSNKPSGCTINLDFELSVDNDGGDWESLVSIPVTTCNVISNTKQASNIDVDDVVLISSM